jgi:hypothetical protein
MTPLGEQDGQSVRPVLQGGDNLFFAARFRTHFKAIVKIQAASRWSGSRRNREDFAPTNFGVIIRTSG